MEHQDQPVSVELGRAGDPGYGTQLRVPQGGGGATPPRRQPEVARHRLGASMTSADRDPPPRETMSNLRGNRLLQIVGILVAPFVIIGCVGLGVLLFLPVLGLRKVFARRHTPSRLCPNDNAPLYPGVLNPWDAARRTA